jgi:hypothetical protein
LQDFRDRFRDGYAVVTAEAMLTPLGKAVMEEAADHILAAA